MVQVPEHLSSLDFYIKTIGEGKFTSTCEEIQNQCTPNLFMTSYFEFKWLFVN
jgi:hypothetical protein